MKPVTSFGRIECRVVAAVAFVLHASSFVYLICFAFVYAAVPEDHIDVLLLYAPRKTAVVLLVLALLHLHGMIQILFPRCASSTFMVYDPARRPNSWWGKLEQLYIRCFSRHGLFGLHGEFYDVRVATKHIVQVAFQTREAYSLSYYLTDPSASTTYAVVLAVGSLAVPCLLFSSSFLVRRWGAAFADSILNFALTAGAPFVLLVRAILDLYVTGNEGAMANREWLNQTIMLARAVTVRSIMDLASIIFLFVTCFLSLENLHAAARMKKIGTISRTNSAALAAVAVGSLRPHKDKILRRCRVGLLCMGTITSVLLLVTAIMALLRDACPPGCIHQAYPWFSQSCHCITMRQNCILHPVPNNDVDAFVRDVLPHVFDLELVQCHLPHGLAKTTLDALDNIYSLSLQMTDTVEWNLTPSDFPPSLYIMFLVDLVMPRIPSILMGNDVGLRLIFLRNVSLTQNTTVPTYTNLLQMGLSGVGLDVVPESMAGLSHLNYVEANHNRLTTLPSNFFASFPNLERLSLMFNSFSAVPMEPLSHWPPALRTIYLEGNPIDQLPIDMDFTLLLSQRVRIQGTPLCARLKGAATTSNFEFLPLLEQKIALNWDAICNMDCAVGCHSDLVADTVCQAACLNPACHYDSRQIQFERMGIAASDCHGVLTGWEALVQ